MYFRFKDHFRCYTELSAADAEEVIRGAIRGESAKDDDEMGFYGVPDPPNGRFLLQYRSHGRLNLSRRSAADWANVTVALKPRRIGCDVEVWVSMPGSTVAFLIAWFASVAALTL